MSFLNPLSLGRFISRSLLPLAVAQDILGSPQLGKPVTQMDLSELDLIASKESVLPAGSGTAFQGREIYASKCFLVTALRAWEAPLDNR